MPRPDGADRPHTRSVRARSVRARSVRARSVRARSVRALRGQPRLVRTGLRGSAVPAPSVRPAAHQGTAIGVGGGWGGLGRIDG